MILSPAFLQAAQIFFRFNLHTIHERQGIGPLTLISGVLLQILLFQRDSKKSDAVLAKNLALFLLQIYRTLL
jgi:hypothetical protein